jgi:poly(3-hydroxybutyrate) depolymerase
VALHGCRQNVAAVGEQWVRYAGYNRWADSNRIVVLYPQTGAQAVNGCWDWWGYDNLHYATGEAPQMAGIKAMVEALSGGSAAPTGSAGGPTGAPADLTVSTISDSSVVVAWSPVRGARGYNVYRDGAGPLNQQPRVGTRFTDTNLNDGSSHRWTVTAVDGNGRESEPSLAVYGGTSGATVDCARTRNFEYGREGRTTPQIGIAFPGATGEAPAGPTVRPSTETTTKRKQPGHHIMADGC